MRLYEFIILLEYKRDVTKMKLGDKLTAAAKKDDNQDTDTILSALEEMDPTKNKQYVIWLANQYIQNKFRLEDYPRVKKVLTQFEQLKPRLPQKDINRFTFHSLEQTIDNILDVKLDQDMNTNIPNVKILYNGPLGTLAIPETEEASCQLGSGTKWCTAADQNNIFNTYSSEGPLYIWKDKTGKYQFHFESSQFMDARDEPIEITKLNYFRTEHPVLSKLFKQKEKELLSSEDASKLYSYAENVIKGRWPEAEQYIMKDLDSAYYYAKDVIKDRWPEAEPYIMKNPEYAFSYAKNIIKDRWPEAEPYIMKNPASAFSYAKDILKDRWPEAEPYIMKDPLSAFYAKDVIKDRWPEAEPYIMKNPFYWNQYKSRLGIQ